MADETQAPRLTGEALWKAERDAVEQRNAAARKRAREHKTATAIATSARERALERLESDALKELNSRLEKRHRSAS